MEEQEFEEALRRDTSSFCANSKSKCSVTIYKISYVDTMNGDHEITAYDVLLVWERSGADSPFGEFSDLLRAGPYVVVDDDGYDGPGRFIWTVADKAVVEGLR